MCYRYCALSGEKFYFKKDGSYVGSINPNGVNNNVQVLPHEMLYSLKSTNNIILLFKTNGTFIKTTNEENLLEEFKTIGGIQEVNINEILIFDEEPKNNWEDMPSIENIYYAIRTFPEDLSSDTFLTDCFKLY